MAAKSNKSKVEAAIVSWQHVWTLDETKDALTDSEFARIPNEIVLRIFQLLSVPNLCNIALVCRRFKMLADKNEVWKFKCKVCSKPYSKSFKQIYMDWTYMKCLRNIQLRKPLNLRRGPCEILLPPSYPVRPTNKHQSEAIGEFRQHPNSTFYMTIRLSVDIEKTAPELIKLRDKASKFQSQWQQSVISKQMITRYYRFMQLKASHPPSTLLIPTLDIEIVWQTHLLRPNAYQSDCLRLFHRIIDHSLLFTDEQEFLKEQAFRDTCVLYEQRFGESYCLLPPLVDVETIVARLPSYLLNRNVNCRTFSYWDETEVEFSSGIPRDYENPFSFTEDDLIMDGNWLDLCKKFMSDALETAPSPEYDRMPSGTIDMRNGALKRLKKSYERFLYLTAKYSSREDHQLMHPTYAIDIMWHSHMQEPLKYVADCLRLIGYVLYNNPWSPIEDDPIRKVDQQAKDIWKNEFEVDITLDHLFNTIDNSVDKIR